MEASQERSSSRKASSSAVRFKSLNTTPSLFEARTANGDFRGTVNVCRECGALGVCVYHMLETNAITEENSVHWNPGMCAIGWIGRLVLAKLPERIAARESVIAIYRGCVEGTKIPAWIEIDIRRRNGNDTLRSAENVESRAERGRGVVQIGGVETVPISRIQAIEESLNGGDGFRRGESTVPCARDKGSAEEFSIASFVDHLFVGTFVLNHD